MGNSDIDQELVDLVAEFGFEQLDHIKTAAYSYIQPAAAAKLSSVPREQLEAATALTIHYLIGRKSLDFSKVKLLVRALELMGPQVFEDMGGFGPPAKA